jgi:predicted anti-sigma-YlaC factor YlaD
MICINDDIIQKYIDGETTPSEASLVENHIASCNKCVIRIENQRRLSTNVKRAINLLSKDSIEVPKFEIPSKTINKHFLTPKRLYYIIAAACILLFVVVITQKKEIISDDEIKIDITLLWMLHAPHCISTSWLSVLLIQKVTFLNTL